MPLIDIRDLRVVFKTERGPIQAVGGIDLNIEHEQTLCIVGESGCGKSVTALSVMGLVQMRGGRITNGDILYYRNGQPLNLARLHPLSRRMREIRGSEIAMIFQEPMTSLNPFYTVGNQIMETIVLHKKKNRRQARARAVELLRAVGIPDPGRRVDEYPHQLSGGMRQRSMIAMALACNPKLLIADEPTTALDVTIQAQVLDLMKDLRREFRAAIMFITHDLGVVANMADEVAVMYLGKIVEAAGRKELFRNPLHPYTLGLLKSVPSLSLERKERLETIRGVVPEATGLLVNCGFAPRCDRADERCYSEIPPLVEVRPGHKIACFVK